MSAPSRHLPPLAVTTSRVYADHYRQAHGFADSPVATRRHPLRGFGRKRLTRTWYDSSH
jgi:hypothetical protein